MMIIISAAPIANCAMERIIRFYYLIKYAQIIQVHIILQECINQPYEIMFW